jgi:hypothetical protein
LNGGGKRILRNQSSLATCLRCPWHGRRIGLAFVTRPACPGLLLTRVLGLLVYRVPFTPELCEIRRHSGRGGIEPRCVRASIYQCRRASFEKGRVEPDSGGQRLGARRCGTMFLVEVSMQKARLYQALGGPHRIG